ncbi:MAG: protein arginine kinase [Planctomycetota bacterium]|nr:protein arginine kinase [Planctomycetota bacterium]
MRESRQGGGPPTSAEWLRTDTPENDVVLSSRVRFARNFAGYPFLSRARRDDRKQVLARARRDILDGHVASRMMWIDLNETPPLERSLLVERHLISKQHAKGDEPRAVALSPDERLSIMVNEEDHLRIQVIRGGLSLDAAFEQIDKVDDRIEQQSDYAFSQRFGYLTACPTNVGTGVRVSVMLHLPGLKLTGEIEKVRRAAKGMSLAVRGFYGEGSEAVGDFFQLSNQTTLGKDERGLLADFEGDLVPKVVEYERLARRSLLDKRRVILDDKVHRALGTLLHARLLKSEEALEMLSYVRLGVLLNVIDGVDLATVNNLVLLTQPAHLQKALKRDLEQSERRIERATLVRQTLGGS